MQSLLAQLRGMQQMLLTLAVLFFTIMLLEVEIGHRPALVAADNWRAWVALVPVLWLPLTLLALIAVRSKPCVVTAAAALGVTAIAAAIGMAGAGLHMIAAGVDLAHVSRAFSSTVWGGRTSPNWPVAITLAAVLGFIGAFGAERDKQTLPHDVAGAATAVAFALIVAGIACAAAPALMTVSAACLASAALLLLGALIGMLVTAAAARSVP